MRAVAALKNANESQKKSLHDTLDALIKLRKEKDDEERKLRDQLTVANRRCNNVTTLNDNIWRDVADIWAICCDTDVNDAVGLDTQDLLSDIFEFCDRATTLTNQFKIAHDNLSKFYEQLNYKPFSVSHMKLLKDIEILQYNAEDNRKLIVDLYESIIGEKAGSKASVMLIGEIVRKLESWEKDRDEQKQLLSERAREAEKKLSVISNIVGADRNHYKY